MFNNSQLFCAAQEYSHEAFQKQSDWPTVPLFTTESWNKREKERGFSGSTMSDIHFFKYIHKT